MLPRHRALRPHPMMKPSHTTTTTASPPKPRQRPTGGATGCAAGASLAQQCAHGADVHVFSIAFFLLAIP